MAYAVKHRGRWQGRFKLADGSLGPTKTFTLKRDALDWATEQELAIRKGTYYDPDKARTTFGEYADTSRASRFYAGQSETVMDSYYRNHITPVLGEVEFRHFSRELVQRWLKGLTNTRSGEPLAATTVTTLFMFVSRVVKDAHTNGYIPTDVTRGIPLPQEAHEPRRALELDEVFAMAEAVPGRYRGAVLLGAGEGLRPGEVFAMRKDKVLFLRHGLHVHHTMNQTTARGTYLGPPKTKASHTGGTPLPLFGAVAEALAEHLAAFPPEPLEVSVTRDRRRFTTERVELLFTSRYGTPVRRSVWQDVWTKAAAKVGLEPGFGWHDLRHHFASVLIHNHRPPAEVQRLMRHANLSETLDTYSHEFARAREEARDVISDLWGDRGDRRGDHKRSGTE
jgi:integrase